MLPYEAILTQGGEPSRDSTGSCVRIGVCHLGVLLDTGDPRTRSFQKSASMLQELSVAAIAATRSILGRVVTVIWMGTSSTNTVVHALCP
jgi:hypothetical protein